MSRTHGAAGDDSTEFRASTPWGTALVRARGPHVTGLRPPVAAAEDDQRAALLPDATGRSAPRAVRELVTRLTAYLAGEAVELATRDDVERWLGAAGVRGFRRDVSLAMFDVPRSVTVSYGELAALAGRPGAARAVGSACARNPLPIVVPCHRVVHAGARPGDVGRYGAASGSDYKRRLLELEDAALVRT